MADTNPKKTPTGFFDLPIETRLKIYQYIFFSRMHAKEKVDWVKVDVRSGRFFVKADAWTLFHVCKRFYSEVMPEYYASTEFHFTALTHLRDTIETHRVFQQYTKYIVLNPQSGTFPTVDDLRALPNLQIFVISGIACHEPFGTPKDRALHYSTLVTVLKTYRDGPRRDRVPFENIMAFQQELQNIPETSRRGIHLVMRFRYSYVEKAKHPDTWGGNSARDLE